MDTVVSSQASTFIQVLSFVSDYFDFILTHLLSLTIHLFMALNGL